MKPERKKILLVDDDARNIFALTAVLRAKGFVCRSTSGVKEGLDILLNDDEIGIVLLDMMMPDMDGYEALREIRSVQDTQSIPVIAVTAQAMTGDRERCLAAGADAYISKPVDVDDLLFYLNKYLG